MSDVDNKRVFLNDKTYFINGEFDDEMRNAVVWKLDKHISELKDHKNPELNFYISSHGGDAYLLLDLIDLFEVAKSNGITVKTIVTSHAFSAGSMLAIAGTKGERYIGRRAEHLAHYGQFDGYRRTTPMQNDRQYEYNKRWNDTLLDIYKKYAKIPDLKKHLSDDYFFIPADKCIEWELADRYFEEFTKS